MVLFTVISAVLSISRKQRNEQEEHLVVQLTYFSMWFFLLYQMVSMCTFISVLKYANRRKGCFKAMAKFIAALNSILISYLVHVLPLVVFAYWIFRPFTGKKIYTTFDNFFNHGINLVMLIIQKLVFRYKEPFLVVMSHYACRYTY